MNRRHRIPERGVVLLALMLGLAIAGIAALAAMDVWALAKRREQERQLLFVGDQFRQAIARYYAATPAGQPHVLPPSLDALLEDHRFPTPAHHLRRLWVDPITGSTEWGLDKIANGVAGVHSLSTLEPIKRVGFAPVDRSFEGKPRYADWIFGFVPT